MPEEARAAELGNTPPLSVGRKALLERRLLIRVAIGEEPLFFDAGRRYHTVPSIVRCPLYRHQGPTVYASACHGAWTGQLCEGRR